MDGYPSLLHRMSAPFYERRGTPRMLLACAVLAGAAIALSDMLLLAMAGSEWLGYFLALRGALVAALTGALLALFLQRGGPGRTHVHKPSHPLTGPGHSNRLSREAAGQLAHRMTLEKGLKRALERDELLLFFQPRVALGSDGITGCEALLRWQHPSHGLVQPAAFIGIAEHSGLIVEIGRWVLARSVAFLRECTQAGLPPLNVSVNVSNAQLGKRDFLRHIDQALGPDRGYARHLELELTESLTMNDQEFTLRILQQVKQAGMRVSLDDFGTGYSSLSRLQRLPIDCLKIDRSFIVDLPESRNSQELIKTVIALGHNLGAAVLAEGVETASQARMLTDYGCDEAQGYYYGRPVPASQMIAQLRDVQRAQEPGSVPAFLRTPLGSLAAVKGVMHVSA